MLRISYWMEYNRQKRVLFLEFVHDTESAVSWTKRKGIEWTHAMDLQSENKRESKSSLCERFFRECKKSQTPIKINSSVSK